MTGSHLRAVKWLDRLKNFEKIGIPKNAGTATSSTWDLAQMHSLLAHMNNPHMRLPNVVHVVGTKGKGSVARMLDGVLTAAGYLVGRYTSPHLVHPGERISVAGSHMSLDGLNQLIEDHTSAIEMACHQRPQTSYFEAITALAIQHFHRSNVDWVVMEAGLGGVLDATNVFGAHQVRATVITTLDEEHLEALGGSMQSIAAAKAGIVHPGTLAVVGPQQRADAAAALKDVLSSIPDVHQEWVNDDALRGRGVRQAGECLEQVVDVSPPLQQAFGSEEATIGMAGSHNVANAATAASCVVSLATVGAVDVHSDALCAGLRGARLPGRFDVTWQPPPRGYWLCLDTAHTVVSCDALVATSLSIFPSSRIRVLVIAVADDKNLPGIAASLSAMQPSMVVCVEPDGCGMGARGRPAADIAAAFRIALGSRAVPNSSSAPSQGLPSIRVSSNLDDALHEVACFVRDADADSPHTGGDRDTGRSDKAPFVCITGSNRLVGAAMQSCHR